MVTIVTTSTSILAGTRVQFSYACSVPGMGVVPAC